MKKAILGLCRTGLPAATVLVLSGFVTASLDSEWADIFSECPNGYYVEFTTEDPGLIEVTFEGGLGTDQLYCNWPGCSGTYSPNPFSSDFIMGVQIDAVDDVGDIVIQDAGCEP